MSVQVLWKRMPFFDFRFGFPTDFQIIVLTVASVVVAAVAFVAVAAAVASFAVVES